MVSETKDGKVDKATTNVTNFRITPDLELRLHALMERFDSPRLSVIRMALILGVELLEKTADAEPPALHGDAPCQAPA